MKTVDKMTMREQIEHWKNQYAEASDYSYEKMSALYQVIKDINQELQEKMEEVTIFEQIQKKELTVLQDIKETASRIDSIGELVSQQMYENRKKRASATNTNSDAIKRTQ